MEIKSFSRSGAQPEIHVAACRKALCDRIVSEAKSCLKEGYRSIGLICKTEQNSMSLYRCLKDKIEVKVIKNEGEAAFQGIFIIPVYLSKGLEFDAVAICDAGYENYRSGEDKRLLYVACTRALHRLSLLCEGTASPLI